MPWSYEVERRIFADRGVDMVEPADEAANTAALADAEWRLSTARLCMADTIEHHTYEVRMKELVLLLNRKGLL
jgi:hypothetical protein